LEECGAHWSINQHPLPKLHQTSLRFHGCPQDGWRSRSQLPSIANLNITVLTKDITAWTSYPIEAGAALPADFNVPRGYVTRVNQPKRMIHFQAKRCHVDEPEGMKQQGFELMDKFLEKCMRDIIADIKTSKRSKTMLNFTCVVDEYRKDGRKFDTMIDALILENCQNPPRCYKCKQTGHLKVDCDQSYCIWCNELGHDKTACPIPRCYKCQVQGHTNDHCPQSTCNRCKKKGHVAKVCAEVERKMEAKEKNLIKKFGGSSAGRVSMRGKSQKDMMDLMSTQLGEE